MKRVRHRISQLPNKPETYEGESIEAKMRRVIQNKEPITDGAPIIYTEKKDGVLPQFNIRTDKWDIALEAMDKVQGNRIAKSKEFMQQLEDKAKELEDSEHKPEEN